MNGIWIREPPHGWVGCYEVCYGQHTLARFVRRELAMACRDWCRSRRDPYLRDTRVGRFTMEELITRRKDAWNDRKV